MDPQRLQNGSDHALLGPNRRAKPIHGHLGFEIGSLENKPNRFSQISRCTLANPQDIQ